MFCRGLASERTSELELGELPPSLHFRPLPLAGSHELTVPGSNHFLAQLNTVGKKDGAPTTNTRSICEQKGRVSKRG